MMKNDVKAAVEVWANRSTWFSSHPLDIEAFHKAVSNLKDLPTPPSLEEIKEAISFYVNDAQQCWECL